MKEYLKKTKFELWEVMAITLFSSLVMSFCTGYLVYKSSCSQISTGNGDDNLAELYKAYDEIKSNYYSTVDLGALVDAGIKGMFSYLGDPYTTYLDKDQTDNLNNSLSGSYQGIGVKISVNNEENKMIISEVYDNTPAKSAGLAVGDIIVKVNDNVVADMESGEVTKLIKSSDEVKLVVNRDGNDLDFTLNTAKLNNPSVDAKIIDGDNGNKIGYLKISKFNETAYEQFYEKLNKIEVDGINSLIIDLRDNTGGYLSAATKISEMFLQKGKVIYSLNDQSSTKTTYDETDDERNYKVYILVNGNSASASEILAAALKDSYGAKLVGTTTYGKGKVQKTSKLSDGTMYKYTSAKWLTPNGECIDGVGLKPDIEISNGDELLKDLVLEKAIEEIQK